MSEKQTRNKFRDAMGDYYKTNRQISQDQDAGQRKGQSVTGREKAMIIVLAVLVLILIVKSVFLDEVKNLSGEEEQFKQFVEYSIEEEHSGALADMGLMVYRIYDIYKADEDQKGVLRYVDPATGEKVEVVQDGRYTARVRGYLLWILPVQHFSVTAKIEE